jgi:excisionase family DNA binding protein
MHSNTEVQGTLEKRRKYLSIQEVVQEYGGSVGFWRKRVLHRQIPFIKAGRSVRIDRDDLERWFAARRVLDE